MIILLDIDIIHIRKFFFSKFYVAKKGEETKIYGEFLHEFFNACHFLLERVQ